VSCQIAVGHFFFITAMMAAESFAFGSSFSNVLRQFFCEIHLGKGQEKEVAVRAFIDFLSTEMRHAAW
jgi:hypothetical protein